MLGYRALLALGQAEAETEESSIWDTISFGWPELIQVLGTLVFAVLLAWAFKRFILKKFKVMAAKTDNDVDDRLVYFLSRFYKGIIFFIVLLVILKILKIELTPLLAGAGILGIAVAYAAKDMIANFLSGIFLLVDQPIKIGDRILIERIGRDWGAWGDVVDVGLRTTTVKNTDGVFVTYPNANLADSVISNFTPNDDPIRFRVRLLVDYDTDIEKALELMVEVAGQDETVLDEPAPSALVRQFVDQATGKLDFGALVELRCYVTDIRVRTRVRSRLLLAIKAIFDENAIRLARPYSPASKATNKA